MDSNAENYEDKNSRICTECRIGAEFVVLDECNPVCPYVYSMNEGKCSFFEKIK